MKKLRKLLPALLIILFTFSFSVIAAPNKIDNDFKGNSSSLIKITNLKGNKITVYDNLLTIKGTGEEDTEVSIFQYDKDKDMYIRCKDDSGDDLVWKIGASGMFVKQLDLKIGVNKILIYAQNVNGKQVRKIEVACEDSKSNPSNFFDKLGKSISDFISYK
jgi:hypothetical protein